MKNIARYILGFLVLSITVLIWLIFIEYYIFKSEENIKDLLYISGIIWGAVCLTVGIIYGIVYFVFNDKQK